MVRHDCPTCDREQGAVLRDDEYVCATCGETVSAGNVTTADDQLTQRDWDALGKRGDGPGESSTESESEGDSEGE